MHKIAFTATLSQPFGDADVAHVMPQRHARRMARQTNTTGFHSGLHRTSERTLQLKSRMLQHLFTA